MTNYSFKEKEIIEVDLHSLNVWEAEVYLNEQVNRAPKYIREIVVIHGYHRGTELMNMVRKKFHNPRVKSKYLSLNPGTTSLILK